jgi:hypothetical protein
VVINAGDQLGLTPSGQLEAAHDVHLPQLHRPLALPAPPGLLLAPAGVRLDQAAPAQRPVDAGPRRHRLGPAAGQLVA